MDIIVYVGSIGKLERAQTREFGNLGYVCTHLSVVSFYAQIIPCNLFKCSTIASPTFVILKYRMKRQEHYYFVFLKLKESPL